MRDGHSIRLPPPAFALLPAGTGLQKGQWTSFIGLVLQSSLQALKS